MTRLILTLSLLLSQIPLPRAKLLAQCLTEHKALVEGGHNPNENNYLSPHAGTINEKKILKINIHYILRSDSTGNFAPSHDNNGSSYSGFHFAQDLTTTLNQRMSWNPQMRHPPNNTTPALPKNIRFVLDAVYFHYNSMEYNRPFFTHPNVSIDANHIINVILDGTPTPQSASWGYANSINPTFPTKYTIGRGLYANKYLLDFVRDSNSFDWTLDGSAFLVGHEIGHLLGLSHTVLWNHGQACRTAGSPSGVDVTCDDGCEDTPTAWYMVDTLGFIHPACTFGLQDYCSNNQMDYGQGYALTPCQLDIIHSSLDIPMKRYRLCQDMATDRTYCQLLPNKTAYYARNLSLGCNANSNNVWGAGGNNKHLNWYFSESLELKGSWEIRSYETLDVYEYKACP